MLVEVPFTRNLDQRPFFNRITGIMRSLMMLGGLISFNLNPMSVFSYPLELGLMSGFINPRYSVDDTRPFGHFYKFPLLGLKRILVTNIDQRLERA